MADVDDMISLFEKAESKRMLLPRFVAEHYLSLPPGFDFESTALILCSHREEVNTKSLTFRNGALHSSKKLYYFSVV